MYINFIDISLRTISKKQIIMPKQKTHSGAKKRFKLTGTGKIKHFHSSASHLMRKKSKKAKRKLRSVDILDKSNVARVRKLLGI